MKNYILKRRYCLTLCPGYNKCPLDKPWRYFPELPSIRKCPMFRHGICTSSDVADMLSVSRSTVWRYTKRRLLPALRENPRGRYYYLRDQVIDNLEFLPVMGLV